MWLCVCVLCLHVCLCKCVFWHGRGYECAPAAPLSVSPCGSEKSWLLIREVIKSGLAATFPLRWGSESSQRRGGKARWHAFAPSTKSPTPCLGSLGLGGGQGSRRQLLDSVLRERSLGLLTQWHYLSSSLGYCSGEHFLSLCKHFLSLA